MSKDLTNGVSTVPGDAVPIALFTITHGNNALRIAVPSQVIDSAVDNAVFALGDSITDTVPNPNIATGITTGDVKPRRRKASDGRLSLVLGVLSSNGGVVDRTDEDRFIRLESAFPLASIF